MSPLIREGATPQEDAVSLLASVNLPTSPFPPLAVGFYAAGLSPAADELDRRVTVS
jgi:hypothetical protein